MSCAGSAFGAKTEKVINFMKKLPYEEIYEAWMPRLSSSAFKILFVVLRRLEKLQVDEVQIGYREFEFVTGMTRNTVISAVEEVKTKNLVGIRDEGGKFFYRRGAKIAPIQKLHPSENRTGAKTAPRKIDDRIFWHWRNLFRPGSEEIFSDARRRLLARVLDIFRSEPDIAASRFADRRVFRRVLQSLRGYYNSGASKSFEEIFESRKSINAGVILYVSWRTR